MRQIVSSRWFAFSNLLIVLICGAIWIIRPQFGSWFILIALLPWGFRIIAGSLPFERTSLDWFIAIFLVTALVGYWAAYDKPTAWNKVWLIVTAILVYYALVAQPKENWFGLTILLFCISIGISVYYFLTYDFIAVPRKLELVNRIGSWLMGVRPQTEWVPIHPNYVAGLAAITAPFIFYPALMLNKKINWQVILFNTVILLGLGFIFFTIAMTTSRGVIFAIVSGLGAWVLWKFINLNGIRQRFRIDASFFPIFVILYLIGIIAFLYIGPANSGSIFSGNYYYGDGSRGELISRSLYLLEDYLITGGGLGSFSGLYSQYLLNIPFFNVPNSHNMFLDAAIELGILGGLSFLLVYLASIWFVSRSLTNQKTDQERILNFILLFSLIVTVVHGMVDDYLFNGNGTILSLFLVALSVLVTKRDDFRRHVGLNLNRRIAGLMLFSLAILLVIFSKNTLSVWNANLGSVKMSQAELNGFPENGWVGSAILSELDDAEIALRTSLQFDPHNRTANQRLGMISMLGQNFELASKYLDTAYEVAPGHRGVVKSLGYCYVWLGDLERAELLLSKIPEAQEELDVYIWWWGTQGRDDLSDRAALALQVLKSTANQP